MTAELRLSKDDPLFTALETGQLQSTGAQVLGNVTIADEPSYYYNNVRRRPSSVNLLLPDLDSLRIDKNSNVATVTYWDENQISSGSCYESLWIEYRCDEPEYCPSNRAFTLTVGPALGIDHVVQGLADTQRRDRVTFSGLNPYQSVAVNISLRDYTVRTDTGTLEKLVDVLSTSLGGNVDVPYALVAPLVILALSRIRRNSLDMASRVTTSVVIWSMGCTLLLGSFLDGVYSVYYLTNGLPIEDVVEVLMYMSEIVTPSLVLLVLMSVFVAFPLRLMQNPVLNWPAVVG
jgi:hypothetical protein